MTMHHRPRRRLSLPLIVFIVGVLPLASLVGFIAFENSGTTAPTIEDQFIPNANYETYVVGDGPNSDGGIAFGDSQCRFSFYNNLLDEAMFINAAVDGPPDKCSISTSIQWAEDADFTRWQTSVGGDTLGPANAFTERGPYPVAIAYRLRFSDGRDTGWSSKEVIVLRREGGPNRLTEPRFVDD